jgi:CAAX prenyl protease-like protein
MPNRRKLFAYVAPMVVFAVFLALASALKKAGGSFWLASSEYWIYPVQTLFCGGLVLWFRREYRQSGSDFQRPARWLFAVAIGIAVFALWIAPQQFLGFAPRVSGFNPDVFANQPTFYWATVVFRFLRLVVVVPFVEEIFWRGFLLRFVINEDFERVPFGTFGWLSFIVVTLAFAFSHSTEDWVAALITGAIYNFVAYRTKSLLSCVIAHAVTNLFLGIWIMTTRQWGFW